MIWLRGNYKHGQDYDAAVRGRPRSALPSAPARCASSMRATTTPGGLTAPRSRRRGRRQVQAKPMVGGTTGLGMGVGRRAGLGRDGSRGRSNPGYERAACRRRHYDILDELLGAAVGGLAHPGRSLRRWQPRLPADGLQMVERRAHDPRIADRFGRDAPHQAYLGRVDVRGRTRAEVIVDDHAFEAGPSEAPQATTSAPGMKESATHRYGAPTSELEGRPQTSWSERGQPTPSAAATATTW